MHIKSSGRQQGLLWSRIYTFGFSTLVALLLAAGIFACQSASPVVPGNPDEGLLIVDSSWVIDAYPYDSTACAEVLPAGFANSDSLPAGTMAFVKVISTSCYSVHVSVEDESSKTVRSFDRYFGIFNRKEGDKNRGVEGYAPWDGKDEQGHAVPIARYLWRMDFNFGKGRLRKLRADVRLD